MKYLILLLLVGCSQDNEIEQEATTTIVKIREASLAGRGVYYLNLEKAECYVYYEGGMDCRWKKESSCLN